MENTNKFLERKKELKKSILKIESKEDCENITKNQGDKDILFELFSEFLEKNNFEGVASLLFFIIHKFNFFVYGSFGGGFRYATGENEDNEMSREPKEIEERINGIFASHIEKLINENDYASYKKLFENDKFWEHIAFGKRYHSLPVINIKFLKNIPNLLEKKQKYNWVKILVKRAYLEHPAILKFINNSIKNYPRDILKYCAMLDVDSIRDDELATYYFGIEHIQKHVDTFIDLKLFSSIDKMLFEQDFEKYLPNILLVMGKGAYDYLSDKIDDYFDRKREFNKFSLYALLETLKKNDLEKARKIIANSIFQLNKLDNHIMEEFYSVLLIYYGLDRKNCCNRVLDILKKYKLKCLSGRKIYSIIDNYFKSNREKIYANLQHFIIYELLQEKDEDYKNLYIYSNFICESIERDIKSKYYGHFFGNVHYKIHDKKYIKNCTEKERKKINNSIFNDVADNARLIGGAIPHWDNKKEADKSILSSFYFIFHSLKEKEYFFDLSSLQIIIQTYIRKYFAIDVHEELVDISKDNFANEKARNFLFTIKQYHKIIKEHRDEVSVFDNIISNLITSMIKYFDIKIAVEKEREKRDIQLEAKKKLEKVIQQYSHSLANTLFPNTIYEVAKKLKSHSEFKKDAKILTDAYHSEMLVKRQGQLLQARNTGNDKNFQMLIRQDRLDENTNEDFITIKDILNQAIERVIARLLNQDYHKIDKIRKVILKKKGTSLSEIKNSFEKNVFFAENESPLEWANKNIADIKLSFSQMWKNIKLRKDNYAHALIQGYFGELLFNALKYRDNEKEKWIEIEFEEDNIDGKIYLISEWTNPYIPTKNISISTGKGVESVRNDLKMLNDTNEDNKSVTVNTGKNIFTVKLMFRKDLLLLPPEREIDIKKVFNNDPKN